MKLYQIISLVLLVLFAGCVFQPGQNEVVITSLSVNPQTVTVKSGTTVTWRNRAVQAAGVGTFAIDVRIVIPGMTTSPFIKSGVLTPNTWSYTFTTPGTYNYYIEKKVVLQVLRGPEGTIVVT
jgi:plastocyanin